LSAASLICHALTHDYPQTQTQTTASVSTPPPSTIVSTIKETVKETVTLDPIITAVKETVTLLDPTTLPPVTSFFTSTEVSWVPRSSAAAANALSLDLHGHAARSSRNFARDELYHVD